MQTVMIEPVGGNCNLNCIYCYQKPVRKISHIMPMNVLARIVPDVVALGDRIKFLWHGGEPLLAGLDFFKQAIYRQNKFNKKNVQIKNSIQTNATLIDENWAKFFYDNNFQVGTSVDGPSDLHKLSRGDSFEQVVKGIKYIQKTGKKVGIVVTINDHNVDFPERIWKEIIERKEISTSFEGNLCSPSELSCSIPTKERGVKFWVKLFDLWWEKDDPEIYIKTFRIVLRFLMGGNAGDCAFEYSKCNQFAAIDEFGDVYVCNRFMKRKIAYLGNIVTNNLDEIISSEKAKTLYHKIASIKEECKECEWLMCCGGGCAFQRWAQTGRFDAGFPECEIRKELFSYIKEKIKR